MEMIAVAENVKLKYAATTQRASILVHYVKVGYDRAAEARHQRNA